MRRLTPEPASLLDPRQAEIVEMRYFRGMTQAEAAQALGLSEITVRRDWRVARARLQKEIRKERPRSGGDSCYRF